MLDAQRICEVLVDCLYDNDEAGLNGPPEDAILVQGIMATFGLHPARLETHRAEISEWPKELDDHFIKNKGAGWTFLNLCRDKDDNQWGEHRDMEALFVLCSAVKKAGFCMAKEHWDLFPGGMPYVWFEYER